MTQFEGVTDTPATYTLNRAHTLHIQPIGALQLDGVIVDFSSKNLILPFMPGYSAARASVGETIRTPCNSALCTRHGYAHNLFDQLSQEAL